MVYRKTLLYGLRLVIITKNGIASTCVTLTLYLGRIEYDMVGCATV